MSSAFAFTAAGKKSVEIDLYDDRGQNHLDELLSRSQILLTGESPSRLRDRQLDPSATTTRHHGLVHVAISPYGLTGPHADRPASDLTLLAAGGLLYLAGDPDRAPVRPWGDQTVIMAGVHGAVGALLALLVLEDSAQNQVVDVSVQEAVAHSLENAIQYLDLEGQIRKRVGAGPVEAGTGLFRCSDGWVYLVGGIGGHPIAWDAIVEWLEQEGVPGASDLRDPKWHSSDWRRTTEAAAAFRAEFEQFSSARTKKELNEAGQGRGISISPVSTPGDLLESPQLLERDYFQRIAVGRGTATFPGSPYRFAGARVRPRDRVPEVGEHSAEYAPNQRSARSVTATGSTGGPASPPRYPLDGVRVADFTWVGAGPFLTKPLADHGADVIKIESFDRPDPIRSMAPFREGKSGLNRSGYFANRNTSKRSMCLDLKSRWGRDLALELIAASDVVVNNFTAGTMEKLGLGYEAARQVNREVIYVDMPMQGRVGPFRDHRGFGLTLAALSGLFALTGYPDRAPVGTGTNYPDHVPNPLHGTVAVLAALRQRRREGRGQHIELAQLESTINALGPAVLTTADGGEVTRDGNADPVGAPHGVYPCAGDDRWCAIAAFDDAHWAAICSVLGTPELAAAEEFATAGARRTSRGALDEAMSRATAGRDAHQLAEALCLAGVPASAVHDAYDLLHNDPQLRARGHWVTLDHSEMGPSVYNGIPYRLSVAPGMLRSPAPLLGEHTEEVCREVLCLTGSMLEALSREGVVG